LPKFGCHGNTLNSLEKSGSTFELKPIKPYCTYEKFLDFLQETEICAILAYVFLNLVAMATPLVPSKIEIAYLKSPTQNPDFLCEKFLYFLHRTEISAILAYFCSNLVAMATPLVPLKIEIAYLNSPTQYPDFSCEKFLDFLHRTEISAILAYFCSNLVAMATPLVPLKIEIAYLNSPTQYPDVSCEKFLDFLQTTKISAILDYFCSNLVAMATPLAPLKILIAY